MIVLCVPSPELVNGLYAYYFLYFLPLENLLRQIDPDLCAHLEGEEIHCQLYGMRWARLLLGREFPSVPKQVLRVWDYLIVSANAAEKDPKSGPEIGRSDYGGTDDLKSSTPDGGERKSGGPSSNNIFIIKKNSSPSLAPTTDASVHSKLSDKKNQSGELESNVSLPDITACVLNLSRSSGGSVDWTPLPPTSLLAPMQFIMVSMLVSVSIIFRVFDVHTMIWLLRLRSGGNCLRVTIML